MRSKGARKGGVREAAGGCDRPGQPSGEWAAPGQVFPGVRRLGRRYSVALVLQFPGGNSLDPDSRWEGDCLVFKVRFVRELPSDWSGEALNPDTQTKQLCLIQAAAPRRGPVSWNDEHVDGEHGGSSARPSRRWGGWWGARGP